MQVAVRMRDSACAGCLVYVCACVCQYAFVCMCVCVGGGGFQRAGGVTCV